MPQNISKYIQISDFILLEMEFNKDGTSTDLSSISSLVGITNLGTKQYFNTGGRGIVNNDLLLNSEPTNLSRTSWYISSDVSSYGNFFNSSTIIPESNYQFDTIKIHIVSGYNFEDIPGFILQVRALDVSGYLVDLSNFTWINQAIGSNDVIKFATNNLYLANRFYDKYLEFKIPSVYKLGSQISPYTWDNSTGQALRISTLSDVYFTYSTIPNIDGNNYIISELISLQLPVISVADNFNAFIAESTIGDFIEYYATWNDIIIGEYISDIESGRISLYTSNNPNDNFQEFSDTYGAGSPKWILMHELYVYEHIPGGTSLLTQKYVFTQENNFSQSNYFRPVIKNADISSSYSIDYICRLMNRMDGSQIIRKATFASTDPQKYGLKFTRINIDNYIPYKVFNRIESEKSTNLLGSGIIKTKFSKVFYDATNIVLNSNNEILPQGTGPLFLRKGDGVYKFLFEQINTNSSNQMINVDLSGVYNYGILFILDDGSRIEILPTYSSNMNTTLGELEFKISESQSQKLLKQISNTFSIIVKNPDGTQYTFYEGIYYSYSQFDKIVTQYNSLFDITGLNAKISTLQSENKILTDENIALKLK